MSIFGFYFVSCLLREAGWPKKQGFFRKEVIDTAVLDGSIDQMVDWAAAIGAGRPALAMQVIAETFRDRDWSGDNAPSIKHFIEGARAHSEVWSVPDVVAPSDVVKAPRFARRGSTIAAKELTDAPLRLALETLFLEGILWGFANPASFEKWYSSYLKKHTDNLSLIRQSGLVIDPLPDLDQFFADCEALLRNYEQDIGILAVSPEILLAEGRALGRQV